MSQNSIYRIPNKVRIINSTTKTPITFRDNAHAIVAAASATKLLVEGFGIFKLSEITGATLSRGFNPSLQKWSITAATPAEITVVAPSVPTRVWITIEMESVSTAAKGERFRNEFGLRKEIEITAVAGDTAGTILAKIYNALFVTSSSYVDKKLWIKPGAGTAGTFVNGVAITLTELELEMSERFDFIKSFKVTGDDYLPSTVVTVFSPTQIAPFNRGKNYGFDIETTEKRTFWNNEAYLYDFDEIPVANNLYTSVQFTYKPAKPEKQDANLSEHTTYLLYLNESTCEATIDNLADFFAQLSNETFNAIVAGVYTNNVTALQFKTNA